jgi:hypothetical protein
MYRLIYLIIKNTKIVQLHNIFLMHDFILMEPRNSKRKKYYINPVIFNSEKKSSNTKTKPNRNIYTMKTTFSATTLFAILSFAASIQAQAPGAPPAAAPSGDASGSAPASPSGGGGGAGAGPIQITQPLQGATWKIGSQETITWQPTQQDVTELIVNLMKGDPSALQLVQALSTSVDASKGSTNITVPKNATEGSDYSIAVGKDQSQMAYIGGITISKTASSSASASGAAPAPTSSDAAAGGDTAGKDAGSDASASGAPGGDAAASSAPAAASSAPAPAAASSAPAPAAAAAGGGGGDGAAAPPMGKRAELDASASGDAAGGASASAAPSGDASSAPSGAASGAASASSSGAEASSSSETSGASATKIMSGFAISLAGAALAMTGF